METVIIHPKNKEQLAALKAFAKALKIDFELEENIKQGKVTTVKGAKNIKPGIL
ncbi:MAG TPA: DUF2683 family protein [Mucilaginibacter sp.]|jgi:hypothetical protein